MRNQLITRFTKRTSIIALILLASSCGGGGSVTELGGLSARFTPSQAALLDNSVSLREGPSLGDTLTVEVWGENIAVPAFLTRFTIRFNPSMVEFVGFEVGDFFEQQALSTNVTYTVPPPVPGSLEVKIEKTGTPLGSQEDGILLKVQFRVLVVGVSSIDFGNPTLADANGLVAQGVVWDGGLLEGF